MLASCFIVLTGGCAAPNTDLPFEIVAQIDTGANPHGIWFTPSGDQAFVACSGSNRIDVIDARRFEVIKTLPGGQTPLDVLGSADGRYLVLTQFRGGELLKMRSGGGPYEQRWPIGEGGSLFSSRIISDQAYLTCEFSNELVVFDRRRLEIVARHRTGARPYPCDVTRDGRIAYVPCRDDGSVSVIDLGTGATIRSIKVGAQPQGGALTRDDRLYLLAESGQDSIAIIYTATNELAGRITKGVGPRPFSVAVTPDGAYALINNAGGSTVSVMEVATQAVLGAIETGRQPIVVRFHPDGRHVFVSNELSGTVTVLRRKVES
jgi:YVTN family beta-propeller protein